jgi:two-component system response regulator AtoC
LHVETDQILFSTAASPASRKVWEQICLMATVDTPVLVVGEPGTGKESTARLIHKLSPRGTKQFRKFNCAAMAPELLERDLFGFIERGPTGLCDRGGALEFCEGGVLFLEDVSELPPAMQIMLLHLLDDDKYFRRGGGREVNADVRILAGTRVGLDGAPKQRSFRSDLYFHLSAFTIHLPPLRERREDIPALLEHFMAQWATRYLRPAVPVTKAVLDSCVRYSWPGNLIELENFAKRYLVIGDEQLLLNDLEERGRLSPQERSPASLWEGKPERNLKMLLRKIKNEAEIEEISRALLETKWNRYAAAKRLNISYRGLLYKIQHYHLRPPSVTQSTR